MKSLSMLNICLIVYNIVTIQCSTEKVSPCEENLYPGDDPYFSFDKDTYDNFECHLTDEMLSHDSFSKLPFCRCTPVWNFVYLFCLFFQHSLVKHDDEFLKILKKFFECCHQKDDESEESKNVKHKNFEDLLSQQDESIKIILDDKDKCLRKVIIEEKNGRIYCRLNKSLKIAHKDLKSLSNITLEDNTSSAMMYFFMRYSEMYLENFIGTKFTETFDKLSEKYIEGSLNPGISEFDQSYDELSGIYFKAILLLRGEDDFLDDESRSYVKREYVKGVRMYFYSYIVLMNEKIQGFEVPKYLDKLMRLSTMKILFNISENLDSFKSLHDEYPCTLLKLKNHLRNYFEKYNLSKQSIERLTFLCFEMDV